MSELSFGLKTKNKQEGELFIKELYKQINLNILLMLHLS